MLDHQAELVDELGTASSGVALGGSPNQDLICRIYQQVNILN